MIRAIAVLSLLLPLAVWAAQESTNKLSFIGPATVSSTAANANHVNGTADVTVAAAGAGIRNCLDQLDVIAAGNYVVRVLDAGTTIYAATVQANTGIVRDWTSNAALCASANAALSIKVTTSTAGDFNLSYKGFRY